MRCSGDMYFIVPAIESIVRRIAYEQLKEWFEPGGGPRSHVRAIADKLATMATQIDAARLLTYRAMDMVMRGERADKECAMAKWYGTEIAVTATRDALEIHGGNGVTKEFIVERLAREAIVAPIPDGTTEIQKLLISRALTGLNAFS